MKTTWGRPKWTNMGVNKRHTSPAKTSGRNLSGAPSGSQMNRWRKKSRFRSEDHVGQAKVDEHGCEQTPHFSRKNFRQKLVRRAFRIADEQMAQEIPVQIGRPRGAGQSGRTWV